jgi:hypothetical protein
MPGFARYNIVYVPRQTRTPSLVSLARPADRIRARALKARAARCPWSAGLMRTGQPVAASRSAVTLAADRAPSAGFPTREPDAPSGPSESA